MFFRRIRAAAHCSRGGCTGRVRAMPAKRAPGQQGDVGDNASPKRTTSPAHARAPAAARPKNQPPEPRTGRGSSADNTGHSPAAVWAPGSADPRPPADGLQNSAPPHCPRAAHPRRHRSRRHCRPPRPPLRRRRRWAPPQQRLLLSTPPRGGPTSPRPRRALMLSLRVPGLTPRPALVPPPWRLLRCPLPPLRRLCRPRPRRGHR
eukprot:TRINITY_DN14832_c0_g1_i5.p2 TRINITY_DN14832_c0_g1~~TRINITY_DN14832_c0_g1_i5.p2  ORF type:complete len:205 (+),score=6.67 TRINITY_DN14832_c0_g1_i5:29-643(+)